MTKTAIVLDADVIIHFSKANHLSTLPTIFPEYRMVVLSAVFDELKGDVKHQLENMIVLLKNIEKIPFNPQKEMKMEYASLLRRFGKGESACMAYCKYNHDVLGSSNLKDITDYCQANAILYLTTIDFLYFAIQRKLMTIDEAHTFVATVQANDSHLPTIDFNTFVSTKTV